MHAQSGLGTACVKIFLRWAAFTPAYSTNHLGAYGMYDDAYRCSYVGSSCRLSIGLL